MVISLGGLIRKKDQSAEGLCYPSYFMGDLDQEEYKDFQEEIYQTRYYSYALLTCFLSKCLWMKFPCHGVIKH